MFLEKSLQKLAVFGGGYDTRIKFCLPVFDLLLY